MKKLTGFIFASGSAYSFSFALDLVIGGLLKVYSSNVFVAVITWSVIATVCAVIALKIAPNFRWLSLPFFGFALVALFGGVVGHRTAYWWASSCLFRAFLFIEQRPARIVNPLDDG